MEKRHYPIIFFLSVLSLLLFSSTVLADDRKTYKVDTQSLNVRVAPDRNAEVIGQLKSGDQLVAFQEKYGWAQTYYNGETAWVATQYLTSSGASHSSTAETDKKQTTTINYDSVRLRTGPGTNHTIAGSTSYGDTFQLIETNGDWSKVLLNNGETAWVASWLTNQNANKPAKTKTTSPTRTAGVLNGYNIVLDPGHGGIDPGSSSINGGQEKDFTLAVAQTVAEELREAGATVLMTRSNNRYVSLEDRVRISHAYRTDAFISLHYDAYPLTAANGISTHYYANDDGAQLAQAVQTELNSYTGLNNRGIKNSSYYVLRENNNLSILVELGFLTNPNDFASIQSANHSTNVANAITDGLVNYFSSK